MEATPWETVIVLTPGSNSVTVMGESEAKTVLVPKEAWKVVVDL